ncbi:MAG: glycosyltransferase, partial [Verrucomicrobiota bacterium]|nr:glycosyltransferase [Verrucomicrobiota bacterium]
LTGNGALDLGLVSDEQKEALLRDCAALVQPSANESFSRVMMEAWLHGKPVAVHSDCLATAVAVREADGGWSARDETDWAKFFVEFERAGEEELTRLGENGRSYAQLMADWDRVMERYERVFAHPVASSLERWRRAENARIEINQFLPNLSFGDAISNHALLIRDYLRSLGYRARIFVRFVDPRVAEECEAFSPDAVHASDAIIYHHSIGTEITPEMMNYRGPKCLIYHNITPAGFFDTYRPEFATILRKGRDDLHKLANFTISVGDSSYNAKELKSCLFEDPGVLPICVDPSHWAFAPDPTLMERLQDGRTNLLFVGRVAPNKRQNDLVYALRDYHLFDPTARLTLVGSMETGDPFAKHLQDTIDLLGLNEAVTITGNISGPELAAYYRTAHLFWSMSEHEGFCVPLIEAMWFDVPVLAFRSSAVPETLGDAAMMFTDKSDYRETAALAYLLVNDQKLRAKMIAAQRRQREAFLPDKIGPLIAEIATKLQTESRRISHRPRLRDDGSPAEVDQFLPNLSHGDAISNYAFLIRDSLWAAGFRSKIFVRYREHALAMECEVFTERGLESSPAIIYHHSTGTEITPHILGYKGSKALIYHNITPAHFYEPYSPDHAARLRQGREELHRMGRFFPVSFGVSEFNAAELEECGFRDPGVFPLAVDPYRLSGVFDQQLLASLQDGRKNLLFVGRMTPNKKQDDLLLAFAAYRKLDQSARLILVGDTEA